MKIIYIEMPTVSIQIPIHIESSRHFEKIPNLVIAKTI